MAGLSIANNLLANSVQFNLNKNQQALQQTVSHLSSGLRIESASDDPSGLAIATNLQTQVSAFQTAGLSVQNANNAVQVADGALQTTTDILQRIRNLAVEAASDVSSTADRQNLQSEVSQLLVEINRVSQSTTFNGQPLLDGSHAGFSAGADAYFTITSNAVLASSGAAAPGLNVDNLITTAYGFVGAINYFNTTPNATNGGVYGTDGTSEATVDGTLKLQVVNNGGSIGVTETFIESATGLVTVSGTFFSANSMITNNALPSYPGEFGFDNVVIGLGNITSADVGLTAYIKISQNVGPSSSATGPFTIQSGASEGDTVQVGIQATNAQTLRVSNINLVATAGATDSTLAAQDAIGQIDTALQTLLQQRAQLGAIIVRLNEDADNDATAAVNLQASESAIRDLNIGQATSDFTKQQILVQVGTSVLAQSHVNAQAVLGLFR